MNTLEKLQQWYQSQCDGDWEHGFGVKIETLDNPGWAVVIDLTDTKFFDRPFSEIQRLEDETNWIHCRIRDSNFEGFGGSLNLDEILQIFLSWAVERPTRTIEKKIAPPS